MKREVRVRVTCVYCEGEEPDCPMCDELGFVEEWWPLEEVMVTQQLPMQAHLTTVEILSIQSPPEKPAMVLLAEAASTPKEQKQCSCEQKETEI